MSKPLLHVVEALISNDGHVLVVFNVNKWWLPGGKVEPGETFATAAERETLEETGITVRACDVVLAMERQTSTHHETWMTLRCDYVRGAIQLDDPDGKVTDAEWVAFDDLPARLSSYPANITDLLEASGARYHR